MCLILDLAIFHIGKRVGYFVHWEPIYIGTHSDPHYDERLSWEGKSDKMTQVNVNLIQQQFELAPITFLKENEDKIRLYLF